jgi:hypothetical protein
MDMKSKMKLKGKRVDRPEIRFRTSEYGLDGDVRSVSFGSDRRFEAEVGVGLNGSTYQLQFPFS